MEDFRLLIDYRTGTIARTGLSGWRNCRQCFRVKILLHALGLRVGMSSSLLDGSNDSASSCSQATRESTYHGPDLDETNAEINLFGASSKNVDHSRQAANDSAYERLNQYDAIALAVELSLQGQCNFSVNMTVLGYRARAGMTSGLAHRMNHGRECGDDSHANCYSFLEACRGMGNMLNVLKVFARGRHGVSRGTRIRFDIGRLMLNRGK